jgi:hypothetical protein
MSGDIEIGICDFCHKGKPINRTYFYPTIPPENDENKKTLYNEGAYFVYLKTCNDCGEPTTTSS